MRYFRCLACQALALLFVFAATAVAQDAPSRIKAEIERLQQALKAKPMTIPQLRDLATGTASTLGEAQAELNAGRLYLSLEKLSQAEEALYGAWFVQDKAESVKGGLPAFEAEWGKVSVVLAAQDEQSRKRTWPNTPLAVRALAESAQGKVIPLLDGGRGFATSTEPVNGLFYLGQAEGQAGFSRFLSSLPATNSGKETRLRSFLPELRRLQDKTNAAFVPPRSIDEHPRFIALNSALKLAAELDARKSYAGALYHYLDAARIYGLIQSQAPDAAGQVRVKQSLSEKLKEIENSGRDDSIVRVFLEKAQSQLSPGDGSAPSADAWLNARAILDNVLPAYAEALKPAAAVPQLAGKTVNITLVRWPYT